MTEGTDACAYPGVYFYNLGKIDVDVCVLVKTKPARGGPGLLFCPFMKNYMAPPLGPLLSLLLAESPGDTAS